MHIRICFTVVCAYVYRGREVFCFVFSPVPHFPDVSCETHPSSLEREVSSGSVRWLRLSCCSYRSTENEQQTQITEAVFDSGSFWVFFL